MLQPQATLECLTCVKCSYSLRGLDRSFNCPECGHPIANSAAALPISRWAPGFRRALILLMLAFLIEIHWLNQLLHLDLLYELRYRRISINPEGTLVIIRALLALPASYLLTRPAPFLPRDPARLRKPLFTLLITQLILGPTNIICFPLSARSYTAAAILLAVYGILPVVRVAQIGLLLELFIRPLALLPGMPPRWLLRIMQWLFLYWYVANAIFWLVVEPYRIIDLYRPMPPNLDGLPPLVKYVLFEIIERPSHHVQPPTIVITYLMILYCIYRLAPRGSTARCSPRHTLQPRD